MADLRRTVLCLKDYVEDKTKYWSNGRKYPARHHRDGHWSILTNFGTIGAVGSCFLLDDFDEYFVEVPPYNGYTLLSKERPSPNVQLIVNLDENEASIGGGAAMMDDNGDFYWTYDGKMTEKIQYDVVSWKYI